jgi:hypothetical protein
MTALGMIRIYMLGHLLINLNGRTVRVSIGIIHTRADENRVGTNQLK